MNLFSHSYGGQMLEIRCLSNSCKEGILPCLSGLFLTYANFNPTTTSICSWPSSCTSLLLGNLSLGLRPSFTQDGLQRWLSELHWQQPLFQMRSHFEVLGRCILWEDSPHCNRHGQIFKNMLNCEILQKYKEDIICNVQYCE